MVVELNKYLVILRSRDYESWIEQIFENKKIMFLRDIGEWGTRYIVSLDDKRKNEFSNLDWVAWLRM